MHPARLVAAALQTCLAALPAAMATPPGLTAARYWRPPTLTREQLAATPQALILPTDDQEDFQTRSTYSRDIVIDLALAAAVANVDPATIDPLTDLLETCVTSARTLTDASGGRWVQTTRETLSLADPDTLTKGAWFGAVRLTYSRT
jgi:hypothetical protein